MSESPRVAVEWLASERSGARWRVSWRVRNDGAGRLELVAAYAPHGLFHAGERKLGRTLGPGEAATLDLDVSVHAPQGGIENSFLILRVAEGDVLSLVLARFSVETVSGRPALRGAHVSTQASGFSRDTSDSDEQG